VRSALTYAAAGALTQRADYEAAADWIELLLEDVKKFNLEFAIPYAMWTAGQVALGQRRFGDTERALQIVEDAASRLQNRHHRLNANALRARLLLQNGDADGAAASIHEEPSFPLIPSWRGEYFATRALVKACAGDRTAALGDADRAKAATVAVEVSVLAQVARAIATFTDSFDEAHELIRMALASNIWDPVVCGVRASPALADALTGAKETRPAMEDLYQRTHDLALARRAGIRTRATSSPRDLLSPREFEVLGLIARGYRNRDISRALYIADSTTKVHMRHIFEKLGVRTRSEAVARFQMFS
jgi:ATP/maltotriose-dependent transcriptional regulator MalT